MCIVLNRIVELQPKRQIARQICAYLFSKKYTIKCIINNMAKNRKIRCPWTINCSV